jgi:hypothetical protein
MKEDFIDESFAALDDYYPFSKKKRKTFEVKAEPKEKESWEERSYKKTMPNGKDMDMYTLGSLADALGRPIITIRAWMKAGYLPVSPYRLPAQVDKHGHTRQGRRLYSRAMIEAAVEVFSSAGILETSRINWVDNRHVATDIAEAWNKIRAQETNTTN